MVPLVAGDGEGEEAAGDAASFDPQCIPAWEAAKLAVRRRSTRHGDVGMAMASSEDLANSGAALTSHCSLGLLLAEAAQLGGELTWDTRSSG
jgi:hypothetical protein